MNWLDIAIVLIVVTSVITSVIKGLTRELVALAALIAGVLTALWWYPEPARYLEPYTSSPGVAAFSSFIIIVILFILTGWIVARLLSMLVKAAGLRWFDRLLGAAFGLLRGILTAAVLVLALVAFRPGPSPAQSVAHSRLAPAVLYGSRTIMMLAPRRLKQEFERGLERVQALWRESPPDTI